MGSGDGARVELTPLGRSHLGATDYWDGNWLDCRVLVRAGGFLGDYLASLRADEFARLAEDLRAVRDSLVGTVAFRSMEEWVTIQVKGDGRGHFNGVCRLLDRAGDGNRLECAISFDQTEIQPMLQQLATIAESFPFLGSP